MVNKYKMTIFKIMDIFMIEMGRLSRNKSAKR